MAGSKVRASGSVLQRDAAIARFLHKAGAEGVHGRGGIGSEKGLSGRGYVNGGRVASLPRPLPRHLFEIYCTPTVARRRWLDARKGGGRTAEAPSFTIGNVCSVHARLRVLRELLED